MPFNRAAPTEVAVAAPALTARRQPKHRIMIARIATLSIMLTLSAAAQTNPLPVLWAWERAENLRFAGPSATIAILAGSVRIAGDTVAARPRLQPALVLPGQKIIGVVHIELDRANPPRWTPEQRAATAATITKLLHNERFSESQIDFEVPASHRQILLDVLTDARAALPAGQHLSMTALASWCDTETWIDAVPVDEIVPMLFRMGPNGQPIRQRLATGGDFRQPRCRTSVGIAADTPPERLPAGKRIWMFDPHPWTAQDFTALRQRPGL